MTKIKFVWQNMVPLAFISLCIPLAIYSSGSSNSQLQLQTEQSQENIEINGRQANTADLKVKAISREMVQGSYQDYLDNKPSYLQGTDLRGQLLVDDKGELLISAQIKKRFDYFYLLSGDKTQTEINNIIIDHLYLTLQQPALQTALALLASYSRYIDDYEKLLSSLNPQDAQSDLMWLAQEINHLKESLFGAEVASIFFGNEDALRQESLRLMAMNNARQGTVNSALPVELVQNQQKTLSFFSAKQEIQKALDDGAQPAQIKALRTRLYGEDAAERLDSMDSQRRRWQQLVLTYQKMKQELIDNGGLAESDIHAMLADRMQRDHQITDRQLRRLQALARVASYNN